MVLVQFFGGPGSGKSSIAYKLAGELKSQHINCELVTEVAKDVTWEQNFHQLKNQFFITAKQFDRIRRVEDKVDVVIMDSGLLQNVPYIKDERYKDEVIQIMKNLHHSYKTINFFVHRPIDSYDTNGRKEGWEESMKIDNETLALLKEEKVKVFEISHSELTLDTVASIVIDTLND